MIHGSPRVPMSHVCILWSSSYFSLSSTSRLPDYFGRFLCPLNRLLSLSFVVQPSLKQGV